MNGKIVGIAILVCAAVAGGALYYLQVYGFYRSVAPAGPMDVTLVALADDMPVSLPHGEFAAIDADSSPIRYRACFETDAALDDLRARFVTLAEAVPRNAPYWFDCFDAGAIADMVASGEATAFLGHKNIAYGVDRIVVVTDDGRGFVWHELNDCGEKAYDGSVVGEECPPRPADGSQ